MVKVPPPDRVLNSEQKRAVEFGTGPLLIIAGAGSGKTTVVTERIKHIISSGLARADQILALTFTEKASREMEERVDVAMPYGTTQMWISTFHAFCDRILRNEAINIGLDPSYNLMNEAETILFFRKNIFSFDLKYFRPLGNPTKFISGMLQHFSRLKDEDVSPQQYKEFADKIKVNPPVDYEDSEIEKVGELASAYRHYEELKIKHSVADYSDLISSTLRIFRTRKNILSRYQNQFKFVLVDEFQDTNFAQNELSVLLAGSEKNITVVGDDDQAIYRWRGAAISNMIQFKKRFPQANIIVLTKNYRSSQEILEKSYTLIRNNDPDRLEAAENIDKKLECMRRVHGKPIEFIYTDRVEIEAEEVANKIKKLTAQGKNTHVHFRDIAILVRANNQAEPFVKAFTRAGIPYQFLGPGQLFRQPEVKDLIAYLKVLSHYEDNVALYRVLVMDVFDIPPRDIASLLAYAKKYGISLFEGCEQIILERGQATDENKTVSIAGGNDSYESISKILSPSSETIIKLKKIVDMIHRHLGLIKKDTAGQILYYFLEDTGLLKSITTYTTSREERVANNIAKFFTKLKSYEAGHEDASVFTVSDWIDLSMNLGESPLAADMDWSENEAVSILTVHSAKGLEFPVVFLINLVSSRFPTIERREQIPIPDALIKEILPTGDYHLQEERRLFYVGMTRARDYLYLTAAKYYGEGKRERKVSPFISEALGEDIVGSATTHSVGAIKQLSLLEWAKTPELSPDSQIKQKVNFLSYSQLDSFMTCPLQYKYRYILKIPVPPSAALTFGDTMHRTVRGFYELARAREKPTLEALLALYNKNWNSLGFGNKSLEERYKKQGIELLKGFFEKGYDPTHSPKDLEHPFRIQITPALRLGGKIDRVDELPDGKIEIIDYKTGAAPKTKDPKKDLQLSVYAIAATEGVSYRKSPEDVIVSFYFFEGQEKISATRTREQLEQTKTIVADKALEISQSEFRPTPGKHCDWCEFRLICEAWQ